MPSLPTPTPLNSLLAAVCAAGPGALADLSERSGAAFYVAAPSILAANLARLGAAFAAEVPSVEVAYSYKTNWLPALLQAVHTGGHTAEVVSRTELELAVRMGHRGHGIIFNGPAKTPADVTRALDLGVRLHVDSPHELDAIERWHSAGDARTSTIGLRIRGSWDGTASRFGLDLQQGEVAHAVDRLSGLRSCRIAGLHIHASGRRSVDEFADRLVQLGAALDGPLRALELEYIDIGGGLAGRMPPELAVQFGSDPPAWHQYAAALGSWYRQRWTGPHRPRIVIEPGVAVVADAVAFVCRVESVRSCERRPAVVTSGTRLAIRAGRTGPDLPHRVIRASTEHHEGPFEVQGYTCMEDDILLRRIDGPLGPGDHIVIGQVGAYSMVFHPPFIRPAPAAVAGPLEDAPWTLLRRVEDLDDWLTRTSTSDLP